MGGAPADNVAELNDRRRANIDAAVRRLPLLESPHVPKEVHVLVDFLVGYLVTMGNEIAKKGGELTPLAHFRPATEAMVLRELAELERRAADLAAKIEKRGEPGWRASNWRSTSEVCMDRR